MVRVNGKDQEPLASKVNMVCIHFLTDGISQYQYNLGRPEEQVQELCLVH